MEAENTLILAVGFCFFFKEGRHDHIKTPNRFVFKMGMFKIKFSRLVLILLWIRYGERKG